MQWQGSWIQRVMFTALVLSSWNSWLAVSLLIIHYHGGSRVLLPGYNFFFFLLCLSWYFFGCLLGGILLECFSLKVLSVEILFFSLTCILMHRNSGTFSGNTKTEWRQGKAVCWHKAWRRIPSQGSCEGTLHTQVAFLKFVQNLSLSHDCIV